MTSAIGHYTLTKLNRFTPGGYGLDVVLFTLSPRPHGLGPKTRFSVEGWSLRRPELHRLEMISLSWRTETQVNILQFITPEFHLWKWLVHW